MHPKVLLECAANLLQRVLRFEHPADAVIATYYRENKGLGPRERQTLSETVYAVLRNKLLFDHFAPSGSGSKERRMAILGFAAPPEFLEGAINAQEKTWLAQCKLIKTEDLMDRHRHNLPQWLADALQAQLGAEFWPLVAALSQPGPLDLRVNALKAKRADVLVALKKAGIKSKATPYAPLGLRLEGKPVLAKVAEFNNGSVEIQDEGSQLLALLVDAKRGEMVVDFCAGAGGKTLVLGDAMRNSGRLYAFDTSAHRLEGLKPRLARSGLSNVHPVAIAHERDERIKRLAGKIDRVLVDAPCSGLGTLRRHPDLKYRNSLQTVADYAALQARILQSAARLVKSGGRLVYATCSLLPEENEANAMAFSQANPDFVPLSVAQLLADLKVENSGQLSTAMATIPPAESAAPAIENVANNTSYLRLWPHRHQTDGFFAAVWQRK